MSDKKFLFSFFVIIGVFSLIFFSFFWYLSRLYEHNSFSEIVKKQIEKKAIYGTAFNNFPKIYFLELVKQRQPEILMVGSSRTAYFKEKYFNTTFVTTPNSSDNFSQMEVFLDQVLTIYKPKVVLIEFDPWVLLAKPSDEKFVWPIKNEKAISLSKIYRTITLTLQDKMAFRNPFGDRININNYTEYNSLGILAVSKSFGYMHDGSLFDPPRFFGYGRSRDVGFKSSIWAIEIGQGAFQYATKYNPKNIEFYEKIQKKLKNLGIRVIPIVMPLPPIIWNEAYVKHPNKYAYWKELEDNAKNLGIYDFLNPSSIGTNDCEFTDGIHPGDVASARVLKKIGEENPAFMKYLNIKEINWAINHRSGHVYSGRDFGKCKEVDFLEIGCKKH